MPSPFQPFQEKYSSQTHRVFETATPSMPAAPKDDDTNRRGSDSSISSASSAGSATESPTSRRRDSMSNKFASLDALKHPKDAESIRRRSSLQDSYGKKGFLGSMWSAYTRGPSAAAASPNTSNLPAKMPEGKQSPDTRTLSME